MSGVMTRDEFMAKHGHVVVKFRSYYKYTFVYEATLPDGSTLTAYYGGNSGEIEVSADSEEALYSLCPYACEVTDKDGKEVESFYDY